MWVRLAGVFEDGACRHVSIHAPVWVRRPVVRFYIGNLTFQFTHPCGCDPRRYYGGAMIDSFNSRTRVGATHLHQLCALFQPCFNSRTRVGATHLHQLCALFQPCFNSRTRVGATQLKQARRDQQEVSIHAPVWVRHLQTLHLPTYFLVSIHAPVWVRPLSSISGVISPEFQFTHPCGCDRTSFHFLHGSVSFNSRTRVGATVLGCVGIM